LQADCERAEAAVHVAQAACLETKRRCEALERFRDKALAAHRAAEDAEERKIIDDLATQRFVLRERAQGA
jgi:flagellar export protein FliJ